MILIPFHSILRQNVEFTRVLCSRFTFWQRRGGEEERAFPICNPPFPEKEERERKGVFYFRRVTRDHFVEGGAAADLLSASSAGNKNV